MLPLKRKDHPTVEKVQELFDQGRMNRRLRDAIPKALWRAATSLTRHHSIHTVSRRISLNFNDLKARAI